MTTYKIDKRDVPFLEDILDIADVKYELSSDGVLHIDPEYLTILEAEGIFYRRV